MITTVCKISYGSQTVPPIVPAVQGDTGRAISFEIADFTPPAGATATYFILKPSGEAIYNSATITDNSILCELTAQSLAEAGENRMQVRVLHGEDIVTSFEVILMVRTFLGDDAMESGTEMNIFDQAVEQATEQFQENAEQIVAEVIQSIPSDYTALTEEVDQLNERLSTKADVSDVTYYDEEDVAVSASPEGWRLDGTGKCVEDSSYKLVKYETTPGDTLHLVLSKDVTASEAEGVYQWQNAMGVPSQLPNTGLIGTPVTEAINGYVTVPTGATVLVVSQFKTNTTNKVMLVTGTETVKGKIEELDTDVTELDEKIDGIEPGLSSDAKAALLACIAHVKWSDERGQSYYDDLYNALYGVQPDPEVPNAYTRYDWIRLKQYSEASNVYTEGSANGINVGINDGYNPMIITSAYSDLNQLNIKATIGVMPPPASLSGSPNSCAFGGGLSDNATSRFGTYWHTSKQWIYCMMHGIESQIQQALQDVNTLEIINNSSSPSTVKINGVSHSFAWTNSNVLNNPISYFVNKNFSQNTAYTYFMGAGTYTKVGEIEITTQGGELISKLIPVIRKADNLIGIWDSVRREFYTPALSKYATIGDTSCIYAVGNWE